jgi:hypothetical protein
VNVQNGPENANTENHKEWLQRKACEPKLQHINDADISSTVQGKEMRKKMRE